MFIAMNRFQVKIGSEAAFETVWRTRESYLSSMAGFVEFHLLKGTVADDHTLYSSHTVWADKAAFEAWTKSDEFRRAHARADNKTGESLYLGHPKFEGFRRDPQRAQIQRRRVGEGAMLSTELADLKAYMAENPGAVIEDVARERKVTPRAVLEALPETMVRIGAGGEFGAAMNDVAQWGEVTLIVHTDDAIFEFTGSIPAGEVGRGYFNLMQPKGLHGHLRHERCAAVAFVERPFMGKSSAFIAFVNVDGGIMFKVFVGRDEARALRGDQLQRFHALAERIASARAA